MGEGEDRLPTITDVARAYRRFLGREVESVAIAGHQIAVSPSLWALVEGVYGSLEAERKRLGEAASTMSAMDGRGAVQVACAPVERNRLFDLLEDDWARRGLGALHQWLERDQPRFDERSQAWTIARGFELGRQEASSLQALCAATGVVLPEEPSVAVFGAEAHRLAGALGSGGYLGVEPRPDALEPRRAALAERGLPGAELMSMAQFRRTERAYDLFYSAMTLQYAPPPVAYALLERGLSQVRPGGLAHVQLADHLYDYRFDAAAYLAGEGRDPNGEIHALPQHHVFGLFAELGFAPIEVKPDGRLKQIGMSYVYFARRLGG